MTPSEEFAAWLAPAMRRANYDIDAQRGGGRKLLAERVGVAPNTITRWLSGKSLPDPDKFEPLAQALDIDPIEMLHEIGVLSAKQAATSHAPEVRSRPITPSQMADELGIDDPLDREMFIHMAQQLAKRPKPTAVPDEGSSAAEG
jgi:transcriptional regulator with XRE-family HTH domain